ncbi:DUF6209 family protein [Azospirillum halopraeferens]|uniref:DUF6209 family protein n=1 Tax=Azospirillum halopraeferens TaxID=34010 RepID=UPI0003F72504|nr:DUF6209 family protein [Azospirillum halopraeferens]
MNARHYLDKPARITFTSDGHELLTGDLVPGRSLHIHYDPRRIASAGEAELPGRWLSQLEVHARFHPDGAVRTVPMTSPAGHFDVYIDETTTRAAVLCAEIDIPADAVQVSLWFSAVTADGNACVDDDDGRTYLFRFPSRDLAQVTGSVVPAKGPNGAGVFLVDVTTAPGVDRVQVNYRVVNARERLKEVIELTRAAGGEGSDTWHGRAPVPSTRSVVRYKVYYWIAGVRFKEDNASAYFLAPEPPEERVPPPPAELLAAARAFEAPPAAPSEDDLLRGRAYEIWQEEGHPEGRAAEHWHAAREERAHKALGDGTYSAWQVGDTVTVRATGTLPRRGMRATLEADHGGPGLGFMLLFRTYAPAGAAVLTPFTVERRFEHRSPVAEVTVHDRTGPHRVTVADGPPR